MSVRTTHENNYRNAFLFPTKICHLVKMYVKNWRVWEIVALNLFNSLFYSENFVLFKQHKIKFIQNIAVERRAVDNSHIW